MLHHRNIGLCALALAAWLLPLSLASDGQFFQPETEGEVWRVGERKTIRYQTTLTNYTIAIWQQSLTEEGAALGPPLVRVTDGPNTEFMWEVQTYNFNLKQSNVFYLWLKAGDYSNQSDFTGRVAAISTPYFNITDYPGSSSSSTTSTPTSTAGSSSSTSSQSSESASSFTTEPAPSPIDTSTATAEAPGEDETNPATVAGSSSSDLAEESNGGGLPVAAQAGIGVGVSIFGLVCILCGFLFFRYLKKKQRLLADMQQQDMHPGMHPGMQHQGISRGMSPQGVSPPPPPPPVPMMADPWYRDSILPTPKYYYATEMDSGPPPTEMDTESHRVEVPGDPHSAGYSPAELGPKYYRYSGY